MSSPLPHQYVDRATGEVRDEPLYGDRMINLVYSTARERPSFAYRMATSARMSALLAFLHFDLPLGNRLTGVRRFCEKLGVDLDEIYADGTPPRTAREIFERKIRYWETRPLPTRTDAAVSPADSKAVVGSFADTSQLFIKEKFFSYEELIGPGHTEWLRTFEGGDFAVFRLTPDKYHHNHTPVAGKVLDIYTVDGVYNSCNPAAVVACVTPYSKNRRVVTVIDTDVPGGTGVGRVIMVEVVAMMIGRIQQCYSAEKYDKPCDVTPGLFVERGCPKSLYRPGSSVDIVVFEPGRTRFAADLLRNRRRTGVHSRFSVGFGAPLVETDLSVRSPIAVPADTENDLA